jgi:hypothetical protein
VRGKVWPASQPRRHARVAAATAGHQDFLAVDPATGSGKSRDQPRVTGVAETICPQ